jgi:DNA mismatch repair protein MutS
VLKDIYDLERLAGRISIGVANARDLNALRASIIILPAIKKLLLEHDSPLMKGVREGIDEMPDIGGLIAAAIADDPPMTIREGGIIREGYDSELDGLISVTRDGRCWIAALEEREKKRTGIPSLKVGFNNVFGYYIEVTKTHSHAVPGDYVRKQTLVNAERYINEELKGHETTVLNAD